MPYKAHTKDRELKRLADRGEKVKEATAMGSTLREKNPN